MIGDSFIPLSERLEDVINRLQYAYNGLGSSLNFSSKKDYVRIEIQSSIKILRQIIEEENGK